MRQHRKLPGHTEEFQSSLVSHLFNQLTDDVIKLCTNESVNIMKETVVKLKKHRSCERAYSQ